MNDIPLIGLGTWKVPKEQAADLVYSAIKEKGVRHIDCASDYGNEKEVGLGISKALSEGIVKREELWITSKLWNTYHRKEHVLPACKKSLEDLQLDYFDLYLIHFPIALKYVPFETRYPPEWIYDPSGPNPRIELDNAAPKHLTWAGMEELVELGLTKRIGVSNFNVQLIMDLLNYAKILPYSNQIEVHPYLTQPDLIEFCTTRDIRIIAFSPFGSASYIEMGMDQGNNLGPLKEPIVEQIAVKYNKTTAQVVLKWNVQRGITVIPKSCKLNHIGENWNVFDFELTQEEIDSISSLNKNARFNDPGVYGRFMGLHLPIFK